MAVPDQLTGQKLEENPLLPIDNQKDLVYVLTRLFRLLAQIVNPLVAWVAKWKGVTPSTNPDGTTSITMNGPFKLADGTMAAPGLAWANEPTLGWFRVFANTIAAAASRMDIYPNAGGRSDLYMFNQPHAVPNVNYLQLGVSPAGHVILASGSAGTATRGNLNFDAPVAYASQYVRAEYGYEWNAGNGGWGLSSVEGVGQMNVLRMNYSGAGSAMATLQHFWNQGIENYLFFAVQSNYFKMSSTGVGFSPGGWNSSSDGRVKINREVIADALAKLATLTGYAYDKLVGTESIREAGLIAQDVELVLPDAVTQIDTLSMAPEGTPNNYADLRSLNYNGVTALLVNAVNELSARNDALETRIAALEAA